MLDMGFIVPLRRIVASVPKARQTLMFSATMPPEIRKLAAEWLRDPTHVQVGPVATPIELVEQSVYFVEPRHKPHLLTHFLQNTAFTRTLVFARTKHGADKIVKNLVRSGIRAAAIHGNKSQNVRAAHAGRVQVEPAARAGGHRHRRPRAGCRRHFARHQLRAARCAGNLRPPHRPHRPGRRDRHRHVVLRPRGTRPTATDRTAHPPNAHRRAEPAGIPARRLRDERFEPSAARQRNSIAAAKRGQAASKWRPFEIASHRARSGRAVANGTSRSRTVFAAVVDDRRQATRSDSHADSLGAMATALMAS